MFIKFVMHAEPFEVFLFEAEAIQYGVHEVECEEVEPNRFLGGFPKQGEQVLEVWLEKGDPHTRGSRQQIIANHCDLFVMNDRGRTVERITCQ